MSDFEAFMSCVNSNHISNKISSRNKDSFFFFYRCLIIFFLSDLVTGVMLFFKIFLRFFQKQNVGPPNTCSRHRLILDHRTLSFILTLTLSIAVPVNDYLFFLSPIPFSLLTKEQTMSIATENEVKRRKERKT